MGTRQTTNTRRASFGWLGLLALALVALTACGGSATATAVPAASASGAASTAPSSAASTAASTAPSVIASASAAASSAAASGSASSAATASATPAATRSAAASAAATAGTAATSAASGAATPGVGGQHYTIAPGSSKATYTVQETFVGRGLATAVGTTTAITGGLTINKANPSASAIDTITIDISKLTSDSGQRDNQIRQRWLESTRYPNATFVTKRLEGLPTTAYTDGQTLTFKIIGDLTIRTVTKEVIFEATGKIVGDTFTGTAKTSFNMADFGFDPPSIAGVLTAENGVVLELTMETKRDA